MTAKKQMKDKDGEVTPQNSWCCQTCQMKESMTQEQVKAHVLEKHGCDLSKTKGIRQMTMHADGDTWFSYSWMWTFTGPSGNIVLTQLTVSPRAKDDPLRFY